MKMKLYSYVVPSTNSAELNVPGIVIFKWPQNKETRYLIENINGQRYSFSEKELIPYSLDLTNIRDLYFFELQKLIDVYSNNVIKLNNIKQYWEKECDIGQVTGWKGYK